jgi:hypothetical protein
MGTTDNFSPKKTRFFSRGTKNNIVIQPLKSWASSALTGFFLLRGDFHFCRAIISSAMRLFFLQEHYDIIPL